MSTALHVEQARAALQADPTQAQHWLDYIDALIQIGNLLEARKILDLGRQKGLKREALENIEHRLNAVDRRSALPESPPANTEPSEQEITRLTALFESHRYAELESLARAMTQRFPAFPFGWSVLAAALSAQGHHAKALEPAQTAATLAPQQAAEHYNLARTLSILGRDAEAEHSFRQAVDLQPDFIEARYRLSTNLQIQGRLAEAEASYHQLMRLNSTIPEAHYHRGLLFQSQDRLHAAAASYRRALLLHPAFEEAQHALATIPKLASSARTESNTVVAQTPEENEVTLLAELFGAGLYADVEPIARSVTDRFSMFPFGWSILSATLIAQDRYAEALTPARNAVHLSLHDAEVHCNLGRTLHELGQHTNAEVSLCKALELKPDHEAARYHLGCVFQAQAQPAKAEQCFSELLRNRPTHARAHENLGLILQNRGQFSDAEIHLRRAAELDPRQAGPHTQLGLIYRSLGQLTKAESCFRRALQLKPNDIDILNSFTLTLADTDQFEEAEAICRRVLAIKPESIEALNNLSNILGALERYQDSLAVSQQALHIYPAFLPSHHTVGVALQSLGQLDQALLSYQRALAIAPGFQPAHGNLLFVLNYHPDKPAQEIFEAYRAYEQQFGAPLRAHWTAHTNSCDLSSRRLRIGYVSPDLRQHSVGYFLEPLLARHEHSRFELFAYAELAVEDAASARYKSYVDHWIPTRGMSDEALATRIRADAIDVLVDVAGHTAGNRLLVFARKPAPVSLSWLGYGYTTGLAAIDYLLTDAPSAPAGSEPLFSETPWRLPRAAYAYRPNPGMGEVSCLPSSSSGHVTFGTLTRAIRINHRTIRVWSEILKRVPHSRLVIDSKNFQHSSMQEAMTARFAEHGIAPERLSIGCHSPAWDTLRSMDIALDCFPHNSGTTLFESLYMGVPFITLAGRPSVGRLGRSILSGLDRPDWLEHWCADSEQDYIDKAVALATDLPALASIRSSLRTTMQASALMDESAFAQSVEHAYSQMFQLWATSQEAQA